MKISASYAKYCRRRAEFEAYERYNAAEHARKDSLLLQKDQQLAEKDLEIARLKALLAQANAAETD